MSPIEWCSSQRPARFAGPQLAFIERLGTLLSPLPAWFHLTLPGGGGASEVPPGPAALTDAVEGAVFTVLEKSVSSPLPSRNP